MHLLEYICSLYTKEVVDQFTRIDFNIGIWLNHYIHHNILIWKTSALSLFFSLSDQSVFATAACSCWYETVEEQSGEGLHVHET